MITIYNLGRRPLDSSSSSPLGVLAAAINATTLALVNAGIPIYDQVVALSVGHLANAPLLDMNRMEEGAARGTTPQLTMAVYGRRPEAVLLLTADSRTPLDKMHSMTELARAGLAKLFTLLEETIVMPGLQEAMVTRAVMQSE